MPKFINEGGSEQEVDPERTEVEVSLENVDDFSKSATTSLINSEVANLQNGKRTRTERVVCAPNENDEFDCEMLVNRVKGVRQDRTIIQGAVLSADNIDQVRVSGGKGINHDDVMQVDGNGE